MAQRNAAANSRSPKPYRIRKYTSSPISQRQYTSAFSLARALPLPVPRPSPVSVVTGAMQPSSSSSALLAAWIRMASRPRTCEIPICSPCRGYCFFTSLYWPIGIQLIRGRLLRSGSSMLWQICSPWKQMVPFVPCAPYLRRSVRTCCCFMALWHQYLNKGQGIVRPIR